MKKAINKHTTNETQKNVNESIIDMLALADYRLDYVRHELFNTLSIVRNNCDNQAIMDKLRETNNELLQVLMKFNNEVLNEIKKEYNIKKEKEWEQEQSKLKKEHTKEHKQNKLIKPTN